MHFEIAASQRTLLAMTVRVFCSNLLKNQILLEVAGIFATKSTKGTKMNLKTMQRFWLSYVLFVPFVATLFSGLSRLGASGLVFMRLAEKCG
jgi:hypothetical protein